MIVIKEQDAYGCGGSHSPRQELTEHAGEPRNRRYSGMIGKLSLFNLR